jgi:hypothetical protein
MRTGNFSEMKFILDELNELQRALFIAITNQQSFGQNFSFNLHALILTIPQSTMTISVVT